MALRVLLLNQQRKRIQKDLDALRAKTPDFDRRCSELEAAVTEAETEADQTAVAELVTEYETERSAHDAEIQRMEGEVAELTRQIQEEEAKQPAAPPAAPAVDPNHPTTAPPEERKDDNTMPNTRGRYFGLTRAAFGDMVRTEECKTFLDHIRTAIREKRAISGGELLIPDNFMGLIRENVPLYSKLYKHVFVRRLKGKGRQLIPGTIPEAVWTEMCGELNEMSLSFSGVQLDGYKVGGFVAVCNAMLEDSDIDLAQEVLTSITKSIAQALDKAILYGTGKMMPLGIVTRLAQTAKPDGYVHKLEWKDVHETNLISLSGKTGKALFQGLVAASGKINTDYGDGEIFWAMKRSTKMKLIEQSMDVNSSGTIVAGMNNTMPVVGGEIETLSFIPDDVIIGGGEGLYSLLERAGMSLSSYNQTLAIKDQTLFIGTARYDGLPVIADGFVAISLTDTLPSPTAVTFAADKANSGT